MTIRNQIYAIARGEQYLCTSNTALPRWGKLSAMSALLIFPTAELAEAFMEHCHTIEFDDDCTTVRLDFSIEKE